MALCVSPAVLCLRLCFCNFDRLLPMSTLPSGLPEEVGDDEDLARFLTQSGHYSQQRVRPGAFLPTPQDRATSVSRHGREPMQNLKSLGLTAARERRLHGAALFKVVDVRNLGFEVKSDEPPVRHALITGWPWPDSDKELRKAQHLEFAQQLASAAGPPLLFDP